MASRARKSLISDWWWTVDRWLLAAFLALMVAGLVLSFAASPPVAEKLGLDTFYFVKRHALYLIPSLAALFACSLLTPRGIRRIALLMLGGSIVLMVLALFIGMEVKGARRWIGVGSMTIQPSEFMKPAFIVICAWLFSERAKRPDIPGNLSAIVLLLIVSALLVAQPDLGQTLLVGAVWGGLFFMAGMPWLWIFVLAALGMGGLVSAYFFFPHVESRINRFLTGEGDTYQTDMAREAIINGGWLGQGPGEGTVKRLIPDSHTDFAFSVIGEEFGVVTCIALASVFCFLVVRSIALGSEQRDLFSRLAVAGLVFQFGLQSIINMAVNLKLMPAKGMTLPFISYGGSSMMAIAITAGFILALSRHRPGNRPHTEQLVHRTEMLHGA